MFQFSDCKKANAVLVTLCLVHPFLIFEGANIRNNKTTKQTSLYLIVQLLGRIYGNSGKKVTLELFDGGLSDIFFYWSIVTSLLVYLLPFVRLPQYVT